MPTASMNMQVANMAILQVIDRPTLVRPGKAAPSKAVENCAVTQAALIRLRLSPYYALRSLNCFFQIGHLHLVGTVPTYYRKQMAQETMRSIDGVETIVNRVMVRGQRVPTTSRVR